jgi:hypothetical protein
MGRKVEVLKRPFWPLRRGVRCPGSADGDFAEQIPCRLAAPAYWTYHPTNLVADRNLYQRNPFHGTPRTARAQRCSRDQNGAVAATSKHDGSAARPRLGLA